MHIIKALDLYLYLQYIYYRTSIWSFLSCFACSLPFVPSRFNLSSSFICKIYLANKERDNIKDAVLLCILRTKASKHGKSWTFYIILNYELKIDS